MPETINDFPKNINERRLTEERLRDIALISSDFFWETDTQLKLTYVSDRIQNSLGYSPEEVIGKNPFNFMPESEAIKFRNILLNSLRQQTPIKDVENWNYHKNGQLVCLQINVLPILDENSNLLGYRGVNKDITDRKTNEERLRESETRYRNLFEKSNDAILIYSLQGDILNLNQQACEITGFSRDKLLSMNLKDLTSADEICFTPNDLIQLQNEKSLFRECKIRKADHSSIDVEASVSIIDKDNEIVQAILRDITARKQAEHTLAIEKAHFKQLFDSSPEAIAIIDNKSRIIQINNEFTNLFGYEIEEIKGKSIDPLLAGPDQKKEAGKITSQTTYGQTVAKEFVRYRKDGTPVNVSFLGTPIKTVEGQIASYGIYRDISERKKIEQQLLKKDEIMQAINYAAEKFLHAEDWEKNMEKILQRIGLAADVHRIRIFNNKLDKEDRLLVSMKYEWNREGFITETQTPSLINLPISEMGFKRWVKAFKKGEVIHGTTNDFPEAERKFLKNWDNRSILNIPIFVSGKWWGFFIFADCERDRVWNKVEIDTLKTAGNIIAAAIQRRQAEKIRTSIMKKLINANEELKDFAYVVSHDLKAPLRAINTLANWISMDYADKFDEEGQQQMNLLINRVNRMHNLIEGILQYSRLGRVFDAKADVNLDTLVPEIINSLAPASNIKIEILGKLPTILVEKIKIEQVFLNLLSNAIKFMDKPDGLITIRCKKSDEFWQFSVADNGPGIEKKYFQKIFQIFQTLQPRDDFESTGIGLTLIKKIITTNGGKIWLESEIGKGTTFLFTLPE